MDSLLRQRVIIGAGVALALIVGWQVAEGSFGLAAVLAAVAVMFALNQLSPTAPDAWFAGLVIVGYLVGNRGFAQLHPPNTPLLPAEAALALATLCGAWRWAHARQLPVRRDAMNLLLLLWIALAAVRLPLDFRGTGFMAVRDFAMVYYAVFFFLAQDWAREPGNRRFLERCIVAGLVLTPPAFWAFSTWPEWFESRLTVWGAPLIFVKSDVAGGFMAGGFFLFVDRFTRSRRFGWLAAAAVSLLGVATCNSRAAVVALGIGIAWLTVLRRWDFLRVAGALFLAGLLALVAHAAATPKPLASTPLYRAWESAASIADIHGTRTYQAEALADKPDNNQFRVVWWETVAETTWREGRWFGVGFGRDLAEDFLRLYSPENHEQFAARSPHNFLLSVFARVGIVGLVVLLAMVIVMARQTWRAGTSARDDRAAIPGVSGWLIAWSIFVSACFGVVLEGPMGAVVFWTALGLANGAQDYLRDTDTSESQAAAEAAAPDPLVAAGN